MELSSSVASTWLNNVAYVNNEAITPKRNGVLLITTFRLIFLDNVFDVNAIPNKFAQKYVNMIPLKAIGNITLVPLGKDESTAKTMQLWCKDWRLIAFTFENSLICADVHKKIIDRAYSHENSFVNQVNGHEEPRIHIMEQEFARMQLSKDKWQLTTFNRDYSKISTYPSVFIIPQGITEEVLEKAGKFRCNQRIPAVSWVSPTGAVIARSSQPLAGIWAVRSEDDEFLVKKMFAHNERYMKNTMYIMDCRPKLSAVGNMAKGLGYEKPEGYSDHNCEITWMGIDNIHAMRDSLRNMFKLCLGSQSDYKWLSNLEYTRWIDHLNSVLVAAVKVTEVIQDGSSVLIHCSDGWDRTPQITSLAQLLLDPYYRTLEGFLCLITKEYISFGHKFKWRMGHACNDFWNNEHCSPIFLQWIDCVWQVMQQFPQCFEFNELFLIDLLDNMYNCYFAEFLFNSEKEWHQAKGNYPSLWKRYLLTNESFLNPFYADDDLGALQPDPSPKRLRFWAGYYMRYYQPFEDGLASIHQQGLLLKNRCAELYSELAAVKAELEKEKVARVKEAKLREQEARLREQEARKCASLEMQIKQQADDAARRHSVEVKVMSEEGEGTLWCKIEAEAVEGEQSLKQLHIIEDYEPNSDNQVPSPRPPTPD